MLLWSLEPNGLSCKISVTHVTNLGACITSLQSIMIGHPAPRQDDWSDLPDSLVRSRKGNALCRRCPLGVRHIH
eukprot:1138103-Pelagomonas_calceolata.AAC.12